MGVYYGGIGFAKMVEKEPYKWVEEITEHKYRGEVIKVASNMRGGETLNDDLNINNRISIIANPFALEEFPNIRYIWWQGIRWKVTSVEVLYPRLILSIGGVYNEQSDKTG